MINDKSISGDKQTNRNENEMKLLTKRRGLSGNNFTALFWKRGLEKFWIKFGWKEKYLEGIQPQLKNSFKHNLN